MEICGREIDFRDVLSAPQLEALAACFDHPRANVLAGGGSGGGKTFLLVWASMYYAAYHKSIGVEGVIGAIVSETYETLRDRVIVTFLRQLSWAGEYVQSDKEYGRCWKWNDPALGVVLFRNMEDLDSFRGKEWDFMFVDEVSVHPHMHNGEKILQLLRVPLRSERNVVSRPLLGASNWDGVGMTWLRRAFWDLEHASTVWKQDVHGQGFPRESFFYLPFGIDDNPNARFVADYKPQLEAYDGVLRESRLLGRPVKPTGAIFKSFDEEVQCFNFRERFPMGIPKHYKIFMGVDWGSYNPFCALWTCIDDKGDFYTYRERYKKDLTNEEQANEIRFGTTSGEQVQAIYYDPAMATEMRDRTTLARLTSPIDDYRRVFDGDARFGPFLPGANSSRVAGVSVLQSLLSREANKIGPNWFIEKSLRHLIAEIEDAMFPDKDSDMGRAIRKGCPDHALTAAWYHLRPLHNRRSEEVLSQQQQLRAATSTGVAIQKGNEQNNGFLLPYDPDEAGGRARSGW